MTVCRGNHQSQGGIMKISYEKTFQGAWRLTAIVGNDYITRQYFGYTKREATRLFKSEVKGNHDH